MAEAYQNRLLQKPKAVRPERAQDSPQSVQQLLIKAQSTRSLEPILIPKLRIYFADFPYLHYSIN